MTRGDKVVGTLFELSDHRSIDQRTRLGEELVRGGILEKQRADVPGSLVTLDSKHLARLVQEYAVDGVPLDKLDELSTNGH